MINVSVKENKRNYQVIAMGHANYAECGRDIVCAGVSSLMFAFSGACEENISEAVIEKGYFAVKCKKNCKTKHYVKMLVYGLKNMAEDYPSYLKINI